MKKNDIRPSLLDRFHIVLLSERKFRVLLYRVRKTWNRLRFIRCFQPSGQCAAVFYRVCVGAFTAISFSAFGFYRKFNGYSWLHRLSLCLLMNCHDCREISYPIQTDPKRSLFPRIVLLQHDGQFMTRCPDNVPIAFHTDWKEASIYCKAQCLRLQSVVLIEKYRRRC